MRILITGGGGFIGGRVAQQLIHSGHDVFIGSRTPRRLAPILKPAKVLEIIWDDPELLTKICTDMDVIIHAAGMNANECREDPVAALAFNGGATARLVDAAASAQVKRFLYFSTVHIYGSPLTGVISEESIPNNDHPYATSHLAGETAVLNKSSSYPMQRLILRFSNVYGRPIDKAVNCWMLLVNDLCRQAVETREMWLHTDGSQGRDFIGMSEVCQVVDRLCQLKLADKAREIINIASGHALSVRQMAELVQSRARVVLGYEPALHCPVKQRKKAEVETQLSISRENLNRYYNISSGDPITDIDDLLSFCQHTFHERKINKHVPQ